MLQHNFFYDCYMGPGAVILENIQLIMSRDFQSTGIDVSTINISECHVVPWLAPHVSYYNNMDIERLIPLRICKSRCGDVLREIFSKSLEFALISKSYLEFILLILDFSEW